MAKQRKTTLSTAALNCIFGTRLIRLDGSFNRSAIVKFARGWAKAEGVSFGQAQRHAWEVARGQMQKARDWDAHNGKDSDDVVATPDFLQSRPLRRRHSDRGCCLALCA